MRAGIGLVGVLIAIGVLVWFLGPGGGIQHQADVLKEGEKARDQVNQIAGRSAEGKPVAQTAVLEPQTNGGKITSILVTSIDADSPLVTVYGMQRNDSIVEIGPLPVKDLVNSNADADAFVTDAYAKQQSFAVKRDGQKVTLNFSAPGKTPANAGAKPTNPPGGIQGQLDAIKNMPTH